jgi:hypothetical protein
MIRNGKQNWTVGSTVKVGFLTLVGQGRDRDARRWPARCVLPGESRRDQALRVHTAPRSARGHS